MDSMKEVYFDKYCSTCVHLNEKNKDTDFDENDTCQECLNEPGRLNSHKPIKYKENI